MKVRTKSQFPQSCGVRLENGHKLNKASALLYTKQATSFRIFQFSKAQTMPSTQSVVYYAITNANKMTLAF